VNVWINTTYGRLLILPYAHGEIFSLYAFIVMLKFLIYVIIIIFMNYLIICMKYIGFLKYFS